MHISVRFINNTEFLGQLLNFLGVILNSVNSFKFLVLLAIDPVVAFYIGTELLVLSLMLSQFSD